MKRSFSVVSVIIAPIFLSSCAIHPLPEDVIPYKTTQIVNHIRCEAREALRNRLLEYLESVDNDNPEEVKLNHELAARLRAGTLSFAEFNRSYLNKLAPSTAILIRKYEEAAIAYEFYFDIKEETNASTSLNFIDVFSGGTRKLGVGASNDRARQNVRNFKLVDKMKPLLLNESVCADGLWEKNYIYPIAGEIGLRETIDTFFDLNERAQFARSEQKDKNKVEDLGDTITFTTTFKADAAPSIILSGVTTPFRLADAGLKINASRTDVHRVIVGLAMPTPTAPPKAPSVPLPGIRQPRKAAAPSTAEQNALDVLYQQKLNNFLNSNILVPR